MFLTFVSNMPIPRQAVNDAALLVESSRLSVRGRRRHRLVGRAEQPVLFLRRSRLIRAACCGTEADPAAGTVRHPLRKQLSFEAEGDCVGILAWQHVKR